jgi:hypothetical protein
MTKGRQTIWRGPASCRQYGDCPRYGPVSLAFLSFWTRPKPQSTGESGGLQQRPDFRNRVLSEIRLRSLQESLPFTRSTTRALAFLRHRETFSLMPEGAMISDPLARRAQVTFGDPFRKIKGDELTNRYSHAEAQSLLHEYGRPHSILKEYSSGDF